jgi:hypothetical protein
LGSIYYKSIPRKRLCINFDEKFGLGYILDDTFFTNLSGHPGWGEVVVGRRLFPKRFTRKSLQDLQEKIYKKIFTRFTRKDLQENRAQNQLVPPDG